jgi:hypothetical protein
MNLDEVTKNQLLLFMKNIVDEIDGEWFYECGFIR